MSWNAFCIATDCDGEHHIDTTGATWTQQRGTVYCPGCNGYVDDCIHETVVTTFYVNVFFTVEK